MLVYLLLLVAQCILCKEIEFSALFGKEENKEPLVIEEANYGVGSGNEMLYNSRGTVMKGAANVYLIFYGRNWDPAKRYKIENFVQHIDKSSYFTIIKNYYDNEGNVTGPLILKQSVWLDHEFGKSLSVEDLGRIVNDVHPIIDLDGIYAVLTDEETQVFFSQNGQTRRFCSEFCGFHTYRQHRKIAFVGDSGKCSSCVPLKDTPSFDRATDGIINILAHEIVETLSNPDTRDHTWKDINNLEIADKCSFNMGSNNPLDAVGNRYNLIVGDLKYLVQTYWSLIKNTCVLSD